MKLVKSIISEIWSLFIDDPLFALTLGAWAIVVRLILPAIPKVAGGPALFGGFALLLVWHSYRQAVKLKNTTLVK